MVRGLYHKSCRFPIRVKSECVTTLAPSADRQRQRGQGHKSIYKEQAIEEAEAAIESFPMHKLDRLHDRAEEICDAAMEHPRASKEKLKVLVHALKVLPLCTQAWEMLGAFYRWEVSDHLQDMVTSLRMYDNAIRCARKLNPAWDRKERLEWGHFQNRPYLRSMWGRAIDLHHLGQALLRQKAEAREVQ